MSSYGRCSAINLSIAATGICMILPAHFGLIFEVPSSLATIDNTRLSVVTKITPPPSSTFLQGLHTSRRSSPFFRGRPNSLPHAGQLLPPGIGLKLPLFLPMIIEGSMPASEARFLSDGPFTPKRFVYGCNECQSRSVSLAMKPARDYSSVGLGTCMGCNRDPLFWSIEHTSNLPGKFTYIEIGVAYAATMAGVLTASKIAGIRDWAAVGVDKQEGGWHCHPHLMKGSLAQWHPSFITHPAAPDQLQIWLCGSDEYLRDHIKRSRHKPFSLALIDACHSTACCTRDFVLLEPFIRPGGIVMFHDADAEKQGDDFDVQPHCGLGIGVRRALKSLDILDNRRTGWKLLADTVPAPGSDDRGAVFIQRL